jgi:hypothetical protein
MNNRYGLDASYFSNKMSRIIRDIGNYKPEEFARECARMSRTADESIMREAEFQQQPAAHLTIPGALEWDQLPWPVEIEYPEFSEQGMGCGLEDRGITDRYEAMRYGYDEALDQFARILEGYGPLYTQANTHGVVGTHSADGESRADGESAYTAVDMTTAAADGFRDGLAAFSEDGKRNVLAEVFFQKGDDPFICAVRGRICVEQLEAAQRDFRENLPDELEQGDGIYTFDFFFEKGQYDEFGRCEIAPGWGFDFVSYAAFEAADEPVIELAVETGVMNAPKPYVAMTEAEAYEFLSSFGGGSGNKAKRRIAAMEAAKKKTCIECDQPYCHGVCVERGDQDYDRDQAAKGGADE